jgi:hypothetical protein
MNEQETRRLAYLTAASLAAADVAPHSLTSTHTVTGLTAGSALEAVTSSSFGFVNRTLTKQRTSDGTAVTSTTLASDSVLTVTLAASSNYIFEIVGFVINAGWLYRDIDGGHAACPASAERHGRKRRGNLTAGI